MRHHVIALVLALTLALAAVPAGADQHPNLDRGFAADKVYDLSGVDSIDLFNGRLTLSIPIGQRYPVSSGLSYGLTLVMNSNLWDYTVLEAGADTCTKAEPSNEWNAGVGWLLSLGNLTRNLRGGETIWTYVGPDGADHRFYTSLHPSEQLQPGRLFSRDGSYLRLAVADSASPRQAVVEFPDGSRHHFEETAPASSSYRLKRITDAWKGGANEYPNSVEITYFLTSELKGEDLRPRWVLTDSVGRVHTVYFTSIFGSTPETVVDEVVLEAFNNATVHYRFHYETATTTRPCKETCRHSTDGDWTVLVTLLESVTAEDVLGSILETWSFPAYNTYPASQARPYCQVPTAGDIPGTLASVTLPTLGTITYEYADHEIYHLESVPGCLQAICDDFLIVQQTTGVSQKSTWDPMAGTGGQWAYRRYSHESVEGTIPNARLVHDELVTVVTSPDGDERTHAFTTWVSPSGGTEWSYALPFTWLAEDDGERYLSTQVFDGPVTVDCLGTRCVANGTRLREEYVSYEADSYDSIANDANNRREVSHHTVFRDDPTHSCTPFPGGRSQCRERLVTRSSFDGLGHYRETTLTANFGSGDFHRNTVGFNPDANGVYHQYPGDYSPWPADKPWMLGTYDAKITEEPEDTQARRSFCFERDGLGYPTTGALLRTRTYKLSEDVQPLDGLPDASSDDVVVEYDHDANGNVNVERTYGGDGAGLSTSTALCQLSLVDPSFRVDHIYQNGVLATSHWSNDPGVSVGFNTLDLTIDEDTGLPVESRDTAGLVTALGYDVLGRLTTVRPATSPVNGGAWTEYTYTRAVGATPAKAQVKQRPNGASSGTALTEQTYTYDGFGRLAKESTLLPDTSCQTAPCLNQRLTSYDAMGRAVSVSEWQPNGTTGSAIEATTHSAFDPFGRVGRITPPDTDPTATPPIDHDTVLTYAGERTTKRRTMIGTSRDTSGTIVESQSETTETYDGQGRLRTVTEPSGGDSGSVTTRYAYDVGGRLASATTSYLQGGAPVSQTRSFIYDNRGFLRYEDMPEKTPPSGGRTGECASHDVCYSGYDALGHVGRVDDGANNLEVAYDPAGRVSTVTTESSSKEGTSDLKLFTYDSLPGTATGHSLGKLVRAVRHNLYEPSVPGADFPVTETYKYEGTGGRVDQRKTVASSSGTCTQGFTWTDLGAPATVIYPTCEGAGTARTVTLGYANGLLTSVADQGRTYASSIGYHPNTMLKSVAHGNGVTVTHGLDPHAMRRPGSIATSGVTGTPGNWDSGAYAYDGAGNITRIGQWRYTYDGVSRLKEAWNPRLPDPPCPPPPELCWVISDDSQQSFTFDPFGNLRNWSWFEGDAGHGATMTTSTATNRLSEASYDDAGNLTSWGGTSTAWYPTNELRAALGFNINDLYGYTADGERLAVYNELSTDPAGKFTITLRDLSGKVLRSFQVTTGQPGTWTEKQDWITRDGQLLATVDNGVVKHFHLDHLGSPRLVTSGTGLGLTATEFHPFGWDVRSMAQSTAKMQFTGHERDVHETTRPSDDLYYMHARYYNPNLGRFLSVDTGRAKPGSPQGWNRYAYARGNPLNRIDLDGLEDVLVFKTERNPRRDPADPWGKAAAYLANKYTREFSGKYNNLDVRIIEVNRVSQVNSALSSARDVVKVSFVGHSDQSSIFVGSESKPDTNISSQGGPNDVDPRNLNWSNLKREATIDIMGCHAGDGPGSIAQDIANAAGVTVTAPDSFLNFDETTGEPFIRWYRFGEFVTSEPSELQLQQ